MKIILLLNIILFSLFFSNNNDINSATDNYQDSYIVYYPTGEKRYVQNYDVWGDLTGEWLNFYKNGNIKQKGFYKNGKPYGLWTYYNEDGSITKEDFLEIDTNCVKHIALWSAQEIADELGKTKKWVFLNYTVDVWKNETSSEKNSKISKLRASSYAEIIKVTEDDYKVIAPIDKKIGWINKSHVKSVTDKNRITKALCGD